MSEDEGDSARKLIRASGLRATRARIATLKVLQKASAPLTHAEVTEGLAGSGIDKATIFRNLNGMSNAGLLRRTELGDRVWRFELAVDGDKRLAAHPHFVCVDCGTISCMEEIELTAGSLKLSREFGEVTEILLRGCCNNCG